MTMRIATWNMQGGSLLDDDVKRTLLMDMFKRGIDVVCLQEMTEPLPRFRVQGVGTDGVRVHTMDPPVSNRRKREPLYTCYYFEWSHGGNKRCSLAIYAMSSVAAFGAESDISLSNRPMLWVRIGNTFIGNVHLPSGYPPTAEASFAHFKSVMNGIPAGHRYVIAGDFNMPFNYIEKRFLDENNFHNPQVATHQGGNTLDYVYFQGDVGDIRYTPGYYSDHRAFECMIL